MDDAIRYVLTSTTYLMHQQVYDVLTSLCVLHLEVELITYEQRVVRSSYDRNGWCVTIDRNGCTTLRRPVRPQNTCP